MILSIDIIRVKRRILLPQIGNVGWTVILFAATGKCDPELAGFRVCLFLFIDSVKEGSAC